jgi:hypothetical protein
MERLKREYPDLKEIVVTVDERGGTWDIAWTLYGESGEMEL